MCQLLAVVFENGALPLRDVERPAAPAQSCSGDTGNVLTDCGDYFESFSDASEEMTEDFILGILV